MPIYEYRCTPCDKVFEELIIRRSDEGPRPVSVLQGQVGRAGHVSARRCAQQRQPCICTQPVVRPNRLRHLIFARSGETFVVVR